MKHEAFSQLYTFVGNIWQQKAQQGQMQTHPQA